MIRYAAITQKGGAKERNEDRVVVSGNFISEGELQGDTKGSLLAVLCDGVGGESFGAEAAEISSMSFLPLCENKFSAIDVTSAVIDANKAVKKLQTTDKSHRYMASTIVGVSIQDGQFIVFNLGDSRAYLFNGDELTQLSQDHTQAQQLVDSGQSDCAEEVTKQMQNAVTRYIGGIGNASVAALKFGRAECTTCFLLCSDGLYKKLSSLEIIEHLKGAASPLEKCRAALDHAVKNGSDDDISIILVEICA